MGWFSSSASVPSTISDKKMDKIRKAAGRAEARNGGMFSKKATAQRNGATLQRSKSMWS